jgi:hypothetical protein
MKWVYVNDILYNANKIKAILEHKPFEPDPKPAILITFDDGINQSFLTDSPIEVISDLMRALDSCENNIIDLQEIIDAYK